ENVRLGAAQSHAQGIEGQFLAQGTAQGKTSYRSAVSVQDHGQVDEAPPQANVGNVRYPDLVRLPKFHSPNQVGIAPVAVSAVGGFDLYWANSTAAPQLPQDAAHHALSQRRTFSSELSNNPAITKPGLAHQDLFDKLKRLVLVSYNTL